jgi:hypothetical protein
MVMNVTQRGPGLQAASRPHSHVLTKLRTQTISMTWGVKNNSPQGRWAKINSSLGSVGATGAPIFLDPGMEGVCTNVINILHLMQPSEFNQPSAGLVQMHEVDGPAGGIIGDLATHPFTATVT